MEEVIGVQQPDGRTELATTLTITLAHDASQPREERKR